MIPCWKGVGDPAPFVPGLPAVVPRFRSLSALSGAMSCCTRCDLALGRTQVVRGVGARNARVLFLGEAPGAREDAAGEPFVGAAGKLFNRLLEHAGLERADVFITNVVACRPPKNRPPKPAEIRAHAPWLEEQLRLVAPDVVATLGRTALTYFMPKAKITELNGVAQVIAWRGRELVIMPLFHPAAALRNPELMPRLEEGVKKIRAFRTRGPAR